MFEDGTWLGITTDVEANVAQIAGLSARDAETWREMTANFPQEAALIGGLLSTPMAPGPLGKLAFQALRRLGVTGALDRARFLLSSPRAWLDERFESERVKALMAAWGMHLDFSPDTSGGAVFPYLETFASQAFGLSLGKGGAASMITALTGLIGAHGGEVITDASVDAILREGGRATGVRLRDGRVLKARRAVIASTTPKALVDRLLDGGTGDAAFDARARAFRHAPGTMMIHAALDGPLRWRAGDELSRFAYVHLAPGLDMMDRAYAEARTGLLPRAPVVVVGQPSAVDPSRAPEGKHVLWLQVRMVPGEIRGDAAGEIEARDWSDAKEAYADRVFDIIERAAPGLRDLTLGRSVVSPEELERDNPNLVGGDQLGGSHHLAQHFLFRPFLGAARGQTPVKDLYLTGASVWPGAGTGAGSGMMLARRLAGN